MGTQCITPITVVDKKTKVVNLVPCGKCYPCLLRKRHEWFFRLLCEASTSRGPNRFVTLTYCDEELPVNSDGVPVVSKRDCQLFLKRLRTTCERRFGCSDIRYFLISEYGPTTLRPHYHLALFNLPYKDKRGLVPDIDRVISQSWNKGEVTCTRLEPPRIGYLAGYFFGTAPDGVPADFSQFRLMSLRPAIGRHWLEKINKDDWMEFQQLENTGWVLPGGQKIPLPRYFVQRLYNPTYQRISDAPALEYYRQKVKSKIGDRPDFFDALSKLPLEEQKKFYDGALMMNDLKLKKSKKRAKY